ncbi:MAG: hypothetical protein Q8Q01_04675 [archaeon]|nr:hypothetical protein [archaeon]
MHELTVSEYITKLMNMEKIKRNQEVRWVNCEGSLRYTCLPKIQVIHEEEKGFIVEQKRFYKEIGIQFRFVYYSNNLDHADIFSKSKVLMGGPQDDFPGSIAVLSFICPTNSKSYLLSLLKNFGSKPKYARINYLQNCFRQGNPEELTRSLASKYMGAGHHLIKMFFKEFPELKRFEHPKKRPGSKRLKEIVEELAPNYGFKEISNYPDFIEYAK